MNKHLIPILSLILAGLPLQVTAEPVGGLLPLNDAAKTMMGAVDKVKHEIPSMEDVGLPVYPGSFFTASFSGSGLNGVVMASGDSMEEVKAWYAQHEGLTWSDDFELFYAGDEYEMMKTDSVFLQDISEDPSMSSGGLMFDMSGMKTQITISYTPGQTAGSE